MSILTRRFGYRGTWLIILGVLWVLFGIGLLLRPETPIPYALHQHIPVGIRAALWMLTGATAVGTGLRGRDVDDSLGHVALWLMPALRLLGFGASWVLYVATSRLHAHVGYEDGWYRALAWLLVVIMLHLVAAWPNPSSRIPPPPHYDEGEDGQ